MSLINKMNQPQRGKCLKSLKFELSKVKTKVILAHFMFVVPLSLLASGFWLLATPSFAAHDTIINPYAGEGKWPSMPSSEEVVERGDYTLRFSYFQFHESDAYRIKAVVFVKERRSGEPYNGPLTLRIVRKGFLGEGEEVIKRDYEKPQGNRYTHYDGFRYPGDFIVKVSFNTVDGEVKGEFPMRVGDPGPSYLFVGSLLLILVATGGYVVYRKRGLRKTISQPMG